MKKQSVLNRNRLFLITFFLLLSIAAAAFAKTYRLRADVMEKTMPDGTVIKMWGFADDTVAGDGNGRVTVPGPELVLPAGDTTLTVYLKNNLTTLKTGMGSGCPVSLIIPGQYAPLSPVRFNAATDPVPHPEYENRVRSLTRETPPDNLTVGVYTWTNLKPGTYLYHSGTQMQCHVQMGLYGAMRAYAADGNPYPGEPADREIVLLYSEIDPDFHTAITSGRYGPGKAITSTINYKPKYFLINGEPFRPGQAPIASVSPGQKLLLRFINAGLESHVPTLHSSYFDIIAEDGHPYAFKKQKYTGLLPAGKTIDAILIPVKEGKVVIYDRMLSLTNNGYGPGGMLCYLEVVLTQGAPVARDDAYTVAEDGTITIPAPGILTNDSSPNNSPLTVQLLENVKNGVLALQTNGSFRYTPNPNYNGFDLFTYRVSNGTLSSNPAVVSIRINPVNDMPMGHQDTATVEAGIPTVINVLANDMDSDMDMLSVANLTNPQHGSVVLNADNTISYTSVMNYTGTDSFTYRASDGVAVSNVVTVTVTVNPHINVPPLAGNDSATTRKNTAVTINVLANDTDSDGTLNASSVTIVSTPSRGGTARVNPNGSINYTPALNFRGTDLFTYRVQDNNGSFSNIATVHINVIN